MKSIREDFKDRVFKSGIPYVNLFEFVQRKFNSDPKQAGKPVTETELRDALRQLEDDNIVNSFGNSRNPTIRFVQA